MEARRDAKGWLVVEPAMYQGTSIYDGQRSEAGFDQTFLDRSTGEKIRAARLACPAEVAEWRRPRNPRRSHGGPGDRRAEW